MNGTLEQCDIYAEIDNYPNPRFIDPGRVTPAVNLQWILIFPTSVEDSYIIFVSGRRVQSVISTETMMVH